MKTKEKILSIIMAIALIIGTPYAENIAYAAANATVNKPIEVLFIGNSLTHRNQMPSIFEGISEANGVNVNTTTLTFSSYYLSYFADPTNTYGQQLRELLSKNSYDFVVLQAQSTETLRMYDSSTIPSASTLADLIRTNGAEPIMYMTWAFKNDCTYEADGKNVTIDNPTMTEKLSEAYFRMGNELGAKVAPAGQNFKRFSSLFPGEELYNEDERHPSYVGSYLAACTIYNTIFADYYFSDDYEENLAKQSCLGCPYYKNDEVNIKIDKETALNCQMIADVSLNGNASYVSIPVGGSSRYSAKVSASTTNEIYNTLYQQGDKITYSSVDDSIVTIDKNTGKYKGVSVGTTLVKATSESGLSTYQTVQVRQPAKGITINETESTIHVGDSKKFTATLIPSNTTDKSTTWSSSNPSIATINENGVVKALSTGTVTITARSHNGYTATCKITIALKTPANIKLSGSLSEKNANKANISISWDLVNKASKYLVYRSTSANGKYKKIATVTTNTYKDTNVNCGTNYFYKVYASCGVLAYRSEPTNTVSYFVPEKVTIVSAARYKTSKAKNIRITWKAQNNVNGYMIYRANTKNGKYTLIKKLTKKTRTAFIDKTTKKKKKYFYKICAYKNNNGVAVCGAYSDILRVKKAK